MRAFMLLLFLATFIACENQSGASGSESADPLARTDAQKTREQALRDSVMAIHDAIMPEMGTMNRIKRSLKNILEEGTELEATDRQEIEKLVNQLEQAEEGMMSWMRNFGDVEAKRDSMPHTKAVQALEAEQKNIEAVKLAMETAIEKGRAMLSQFEGN